MFSSKVLTELAEVLEHPRFGARRFRTDEYDLRGWDFVKKVLTDSGYVIRGRVLVPEDPAEQSSYEIPLSVDGQIKEVDLGKVTLRSLMALYHALVHEPRTRISKARAAAGTSGVQQRELNRAEARFEEAKRRREAFDRGEQVEATPISMPKSRKGKARSLSWKQQNLSASEYLARFADAEQATQNLLDSLRSDIAGTDTGTSSADPARVDEGENSAAARLGIKAAMPSGHMDSNEDSAAETRSIRDEGDSNEESAAAARVLQDEGDTDEESAAAARVLEDMGLQDEADTTEESAAAARVLEDMGLQYEGGDDEEDVENDGTCSACGRLYGTDVRAGDLSDVLGVQEDDKVCQHCFTSASFTRASQTRARPEDNDEDGVGDGAASNQVVAWECVQCTFLNKPTFARCKVCRAARPKKKKVLLRDWECARCTFINNKYRKKCDWCRYPRPKR